MVLPLEGVRVLAQAIVWAGPTATLLLADLGAEVIEVETIQHLNPTRAPMRHLRPELADGPTGAAYYRRDMSEGFWDRHANFNYTKRGHKSITLDLRRKQGLELFYELARKSDVFVENNAAAVVEHLHIDWPALSKVNPRLIMVRFPGFGLGGPYTYYKGFAPSFEAVIGHTSIRGYRDMDETRTPQISHGDANAGINVAFAVQAALIARERTGEGQLIELSHAEAVAPHIAHAWMDYAMNGRVQDHWGNRHPSMAPYGVFRCRGPHEEWVALAVPSDETFGALCQVMGQPALADDERFADIVERYEHQDELEPLIEAWTSQHGQRELMEWLQAAGVPAAMVVRQPELFDDPHLAARGFWREITHPECGTERYPGPPAQFRHTPIDPRTPAPLLGQHNEEVLKGLLGVSEAQYEQLLADDIIGTVYLESAT